MTSPAPAPMVDLDAIKKRHSDLCAVKTPAAKAHIVDLTMWLWDAHADRAALLSYIDSLPTPGEVERLTASRNAWKAQMQRYAILGDEYLQRAEKAEAERDALKRRVVELEAELSGIRGIQFSPTGDNHHNALLCPHCNPKRLQLRTPGTVEVCVRAMPNRPEYDGKCINAGMCGWDCKAEGCPVRHSPKPTEAQREGGV